MGKYKYDNLPIKIGDIVEITNGYPEYDRPKGSLAIVEELNGSLVLIADKRGPRQEWSKNFVKKILTEPGLNAKAGNDIIFIQKTDNGATREKVYVCNKVSTSNENKYIHFNGITNKAAHKFRVLIKEPKQNALDDTSKKEIIIDHGSFNATESDTWACKKEFAKHMNKLIQKENEMNTVEIKVNGKEINLSNQEPEAPKTDLETSSKTITKWYNEEGDFVTTIKQTKKQAKKDLQKPDRLGWTFVTYTRSGSATTEIPVKEL